MVDRLMVWARHDLACRTHMGHVENLKPSELAWPTSHHLLIGDGPYKTDCKQMAKAVDYGVGRCSFPEEPYHADKVWGCQELEPSSEAGSATLTRHVDEPGDVGYSQALVGRERLEGRGDHEVESRVQCSAQGTVWSADAVVHVAIVDDAVKRRLALRSSCSYNLVRHSCTAVGVETWKLIWKFVTGAVDCHSVCLQACCGSEQHVEWLVAVAVVG